MKIEGTIQKKSLAEEVAGHLSKQINEGKLKEGEKLPTEPELMKLFGVGRSTIREATRILANMGLVSVQQGRGTFANHSGENHESFSNRLKRADIRELREVRDMLESSVAKLAALRRTAADLEAMKRHLQERRKASGSGEVEQCIMADVDFHKSMAHATHNEILTELYNAMTVHLSAGFQYIYKDTSRLSETQAIHEEMLHCVEMKDADNAMRIAKLFWKDAEEGGSDE